MSVDLKKPITCVLFAFHVENILFHKKHTGDVAHDGYTKSKSN